MKLNINEIKEIPAKVGSGYCVFGEPSEKVKDWLAYHRFETLASGQFTNILIPADYDIAACFHEREPFQFVDGFSPNLNKHLHFGHSSNFVLAKALQKLGVGKQFIANLGDTLTTGDVTKEDALEAYQKLIHTYEYQVDKIFFASQLNGVEGLVDGVGEWEGTKVFDLGEKKVVGVKSTGVTTYFYQDVALAQTLNASTLYMTGSEQAGHFADLKVLFPHTEHSPLGLVSVNGGKMSSRLGNVICLAEVIDLFKEKFGDNDSLVWNVLAGYILKSVPSTAKSINLDQLDNVKLSTGLYLSYTLAKLKSATLQIDTIQDFHSQQLKFKYLKAKFSLQPNILLEGLFDLAKQISSLYESYQIRGNEANQKIYKPLAEDLLFGMQKIGLMDVDKV